MEFTLKMNLDNAAFSAFPEAVERDGAEVARILRALAADIDRNSLDRGDGGSLRDANGNRVGVWAIKGRR